MAYPRQILKYGAGIFAALGGVAAAFASGISYSWAIQACAKAPAVATRLVNILSNSATTAQLEQFQAALSDLNDSLCRVTNPTAALAVAGMIAGITALLLALHSHLQNNRKDYQSINDVRPA